MIKKGEFDHLWEGYKAGVFTQEDLGDMLGKKNVDNGKTPQTDETKPRLFKYWQKVGGWLSLTPLGQSCIDKSYNGVGVRPTTMINISTVGVVQVSDPEEDPPTLFIRCGEETLSFCFKERENVVTGIKEIQHLLQGVEYSVVSTYERELEHARDQVRQSEHRALTARRDLEKFKTEAEVETSKVTKVLQDIKGMVTKLDHEVPNFVAMDPTDYESLTQFCLNLKAVFDAK